jgi:hypothetical protein
MLACQPPNVDHEVELDDEPRVAQIRVYMWNEFDSFDRRSIVLLFVALNLLMDFPNPTSVLLTPSQI